MYFYNLFYNHCKQLFYGWFRDRQIYCPEILGMTYQTSTVKQFETISQILRYKGLAINQGRFIKTNIEEIDFGISKYCDNKPEVRAIEGYNKEVLLNIN